MPTDICTPTVFVVDDDRQMRQSLTELLTALGYATRAFAGASSFHRFYRANMPGCLLLDVRMPEQDGLALYRQLLEEGKRLPVVFITAHADVSSAVAAMKTGAVEFLEKPFDRDVLTQRVEQALRLDAQWRQRDAQFAAIDERIAQLSETDRETLDMVLAGKSNKAMASKLFLTQRAVEMRRASLLRKLQVSCMAELIDLAVTHRILSELRFAGEQRMLQ
jgi:FixJ family two-component response regulator